jgi:type I restriction enzyme R subunit
MLDTGFDCPEVVNLVFARFTRSTILYQQMRGRGTRKARNKPIFTMFDFVGVTDYHGDDDELAEGGIVMEAASRRNTNRAGCWRWTSTTTSTPPPANGSRSTRTATWSSPRLEQRPPSWAPASRPGCWHRPATRRSKERWLRMLGSQIRANADTTGRSSCPSTSPFPPLLADGRPAEARASSAVPDARLETLPGIASRRRALRR